MSFVIVFLHLYYKDNKHNRKLNQLTIDTQKIDFVLG